MPPLLLAALLAVAPATDLGEPLTLHGYSGHLDVPSAFTHAPGTLHLLGTNEKDPRARAADVTRTYAVSAGFLRWLEGAGRLTDTGIGPPAAALNVRDLSFGAKLRLPLDLLWPELPVALALGTADEGGATPVFRSRYAVASARVRWLTASLGRGTGPDRLKGTFAGATLAPTRYTDLLADWDARELNTGVRLRLPFQLFGVPLELGAIAKTSVQNWPRVELAGTLALPLALTKWREAPAADAAPPSAGGTLRPSTTPPLRGGYAQDERGGGDPLAVRADRSQAPVAVSAPAADRPQDPFVVSVAPPAAARSRTTEGDAPPASIPPPDPFAAIESRLDDLGLSNVRAAQEGERCSVEYENERYGHAEIDALGLVLGTLATLGPEACTEFQVLVDRQQLPLAALEGPMAALRAYFAEPAGAGSLRDLVRLRWKPARPAALAARPPRNPSALHGAISLAPGLLSFLATELSIVDVMVSLRPDATLQLWPGAELAVRGDVPLYRTRQLGAAGGFRDYSHDPRLEDALLQQVVPIAPGLTALAAAGIHRAHGAGVLGEVQLTPGGGAHALGLQASATRVLGALPAPTPVEVVPHGPSLIGTWRWSAPWSIVTLVRAGRFYAGDRGASLDVMRFFGDTRIGVFYARTDVAILGVSLSLPLGPRRDTRPGPIQLRGTHRFTHEVFTVVRERVNTLRPGIAIAPQTPWNLETTWLDDARLTQGSVAEALPRARHAFMRWR